MCLLEVIGSGKLRPRTHGIGELPPTLAPKNCWIWDIELFLRFAMLVETWTVSSPNATVMSMSYADTTKQKKLHVCFARGDTPTPSPLKPQKNMGVEIPGGGLATAFCSYKALLQPPHYINGCLTSKTTKKNPTKRKRPTLLKPLLKDNVILDVYIDL